MQLFPVLFCVVRAENEFDFRLVTKGTPNNW